MNMVGKFGRRLVACGIAAAYLSAATFAQPPHAIHYQGRLVDGTNLVNGVVGMEFLIYEVPVGSSPSFSQSNQVTVVDGLYHVYIGEDESLDGMFSLVNLDDLFLEIRVNGVPLSPREPLVSVPRALIAAGVPDGAISTAMISDGAVMTEKIGYQAITTETIAPHAIAGSVIAPHTVQPANLALASSGLGAFIPLTNSFHPSPLAGSHFGFSLSRAGRFQPFILVGAPGSDIGAASAGAVWRFPHSGSQLNLTFPFTITNPAPSVNAQFGYAIAPMGPDAVSHYVIGIPGANAGILTNSGAVAMYVDNAFAGMIVNPQPEAGARFGHALAAGPDDGFLVGAPFSSINKTNAGAAFFFGSAGNLIAQFGTTLDANGDRFGASVLAIDTNRIIIGAPGVNAGATDAGRIYEFTRDGVIMRIIPSPSPRPGGGFGSSLALVGNGMIAVGEPGTNNQGVIHLLRSDLTYYRTLSVNPSGANPRFGSSIAALGPGMIAAGAPCTETSLFSCQGSVFIFDAAGEASMSIIDPNVTISAQYGTSLLALDSRTLIIGAPFDTVGGQPQSGSIAILRTDTYMEGLIAEGVRNQAIGIDQLNTTSVDTRYVNRSGDTMTGPLQIDALGVALNVGGVVSASDQIRASNGSSFFPAYAFSAQNNLGLYRPTANNLGFVTTGSERMRITGDGRVGIGFDDPDEILTINGNLRAVGRILPSNGTESAPAYSFSSQNNLGLYRPAANALGFVTAGSERMRINSAGNVGIGTLTPGSELHVRRGLSGTSTHSTSVLAVENNTNAFIQLMTPAGAFSGIYFGSPVDSIDASVRYNFLGGRELVFRSGGNSTRMVILTNGNVGIGTTVPTNRLQVAGIVQATGYITSSDRDAKENIQPVSPGEILEKVVALPISTWTFKDEPNGIHIGPMAQDFFATFGFGNTDTGIMTVDADGVALAAIQALVMEKAELQTRVAELEEENTRLREGIEVIRKHLGL